MPRTLLLTLLLALSPLTLAQTNPILPNADPFITLHPIHGQYLLLATTGHNITLWSGPTIPTAATHSKVLFTPTDGLTQLWSPTLWHLAGSWWIYFTAEMPGQPHAIYVLQSDTADPLGSYTFRGQLPLDHPAIDPSLLQLNGVNYLMFVSLDHGENAIQIVPLTTPMHPAGPSTLIAEPELPWEKGAGSTRNYPVAEGPTVLSHAGKTFIVYSASDTAAPVYCLGLLTLKGGDPLTRANWIKSPQPVFAASPANSIYGPGRGTFAQSPDGTYWLLYAAKSTADPTPAHRATRAQPFTWNTDGSPNFATPLKDGPIPPHP
jgi:GH43 family beta-xylosidase